MLAEHKIPYTIEVSELLLLGKNANLLICSGKMLSFDELDGHEFFCCLRRIGISLTTPLFYWLLENEMKPCGRCARHVIETCNSTTIEERLRENKQIIVPKNKSEILYALTISKKKDGRSPFEEQQGIERNTVKANVVNKQLEV